MTNIRPVFDQTSITFLATVCLTSLFSGCDDLPLPGSGKSTPPPVTYTPPEISSPFASQQEGMGNTTLYQSANAQPKFQISNLRKLPNDHFEIDWRRTSAANVFDVGFQSLLLRFPSQSSPVEINLHFRPGQDKGTISGQLISFNFGGPKQQGHALDRGCEIFIANVTGFDAYKLSNSLTVGGVSELTPKTPPAKPKPAKANSQTASTSNLPRQEKPTEKEPVPETELSPVPASLTLKEGLYLYAQLSGNWIPVKILAVEADQKVKVHWLGFNDAWDSTVEQSKLKVKTSELELLTSKP